MSFLTAGFLRPGAVFLLRAETRETRRICPVGARLKSLYEEQARARQSAAGGDRKSVSANWREAISDTGKAVEQAVAAHPDATQQQIAEVVGISRSRVSEIVGEVSAKSEPKLLKHGGNMAEQDSHKKVDHGANRAYILARLKRDGHQELAEQVKAGTLSARQAGIQAGFVKPESGLTALNRAWKKASAEERAAFMRNAGLVPTDKLSAGISGVGCDGQLVRRIPSLVCQFYAGSRLRLGMQGFINPLALEVRRLLQRSVRRFFLNRGGKVSGIRCPRVFAFSLPGLACASCCSVRYCLPR